MAVSLTWRSAPEEESGVRLTLEAENPAQFLKLAAERSLGLHTEGLAQGGGPTLCLACGHPELFSQRDFPRALGITIVVLAAVLAPATHYVSLAVAALADFLLYHVSRKVVVCYVCEAEHRGFPESPRHPSFDREIEERLRYGPKAVMGKPMRAGGTADAPEPEH